MEKKRRKRNAHYLFILFAALSVAVILALLYFMYLSEENFKGLDTLLYDIVCIFCLIALSIYLVGFSVMSAAKISGYDNDLNLYNRSKYGL